MEIKLESGNVEKIRIVENTLFVWFKHGKVYKYEEVPYSVSIGMSQTDTVGAYLQEEIKGKYEYSKSNEVEVIEYANEEINRLRHFASNSSGLYYTDLPETMPEGVELFQITFNKRGV